MTKDWVIQDIEGLLNIRIKITSSYPFGLAVLQSLFCRVYVKRLIEIPPCQVRVIAPAISCRYGTVRIGDNRKCVRKIIPSWLCTISKSRQVSVSLCKCLVPLDLSLSEDYCGHSHRWYDQSPYLGEALLSYQLVSLSVPIPAVWELVSCHPKLRSEASSR